MTTITTPAVAPQMMRRNVGRWLVWSLFAITLIVAPHVFRGSLALTMLSQMGYMIIICLSYNMLLGCTPAWARSSRYM